MRGKSKCSWRTTEHTRLIRRKFVHEFFEYVNDAKADVYACSRVEKNERGTIDAHSTTSRGMLAKGVPEPRCTTFQLIPRDFVYAIHSCTFLRIQFLSSLRREIFFVDLLDRLFRKTRESPSSFLSNVTNEPNSVQVG